jgi:hypothetical protein
MEAVHVEWRGVVIVARCDVPLPARSYRAAVALPGLLLGASAGDVAVLWALRKYRADEEVVDRSGGRQS